MSKKPLKASTRKKLEEVMQVKRKKIESLHRLPPYTVVFCEGIKTEPYYIEGLTKQVNQKYAQYTTNDRVTVIGTGRNTRSLLEYARKTVGSKFPECSVVWLMYDKDDFPYDDFDNTQFSAESRSCNQEYHVAWSNECIELWFIMHYQPLFSHISRDQYINILRQYFPYEKNMRNIYGILSEKTPIAIANAIMLYSQYGSETPPSQRTPATRVHELVMYLQEYL